MRHRATTVAGVLAAAALLLSACSSGGSEWTTVNLDGEVRTGDGPTFHPGERLLLKFPEVCGYTGLPESSGTLIVDLNTRSESRPRGGPGRKVPLTRVELEFTPRWAVGEIKFVLPNSLPPDSYVLHAECVFPDSDTGNFYARWDVTIEGGVKRAGSTEKLAVDFEGGRTIHLMGSGKSSVENNRIARVNIFPRDCRGDCLSKYQGLIYRYDVVEELVDGISRGIDAEIVLPDAIPAGEYLMTPGPDGDLGPVPITLGEP